MFNGRSLSYDLSISQKFALIEVKGNNTILIRNLGHQDEHVFLINKDDWNLNYDQALAKGYIDKLAQIKDDCIIYRCNLDNKVMPDYSYFL